LSDGWFEGDSVTEGFELGDEALLVGGAGASLVEVVAAEVGVGLAGGEKVPGDDKDGVADGDGGPSRSAAASDAVVVGRQVGVFGAGGGVGGLDESDPEPSRSVAGAAGAMLAGRLVVPGAYTRLRC
jgi:hypothetical protein